MGWAHADQRPGSSAWCTAALHSASTTDILQLSPNEVLWCNRQTCRKVTLKKAGVLADNLQEIWGLCLSIVEELVFLLPLTEDVHHFACFMPASATHPLDAPQRGLKNIIADHLLNLQQAMHLWINETTSDMKLARLTDMASFLQKSMADCRTTSVISLKIVKMKFVSAWTENAFGDGNVCLVLF